MAETAPQAAPPSGDDGADGSSDAPSLLGDAAVSKLARWGIAAGTLVGALVVALLRGGAPAMLVLAGGTLLGAIALFWASLRAIVDDDGETREVHEMDPLDARHTMLLRQLKDLDAEHALGRTEDADYNDMVARVRVELKAVLREQDARVAPFEVDAEALLSKARATKKARPKPAAAAGAPSSPDAAKEREGEAEAAPASAEASTRDHDDEDDDSGSAAERACPSCTTPNDGDAVFCKKCGTRLGEPDALAAPEGEGEKADP